MTMPTHPENDPNALSNAHRAESEINYPKVIAVGVISLVIFAGCTIWAAVILSRETAHVEAQQLGAAAGKDILRDGSASSAGAVHRRPRLLLARGARRSSTPGWDRPGSTTSYRER
jgi:hypothetical protein